MIVCIRTQLTFTLSMCSEVRQELMTGTPDAPCSGFMREMQVWGVCGGGHGGVFMGGCGGGGVSIIED